MNAKQVGFVDDHLDNFHANTYLDALRGPLAFRGWKVSGVTALQYEKGVAWAKEKGLPYFHSVGELAPVCDAFLVLAPSTPDTHLALCEMVLPYGKPTFVDKTFAPSAAIAEQIFLFADASSAPIQTTSALRTTNVQQVVAALDVPLTGMALWAGGSSFEEYGVHPVELAVSCLGPEVDRIAVSGGGSCSTLLLDFSGGRTATIHFNADAHIPFFSVLETERGAQPVEVDDSTLFLDAAAAILDFFDAGKPLIPREQTIAIMRVLDAYRRPESRDGWVKLGT
ncbi:hypothetical protein [Aeoliella sp. SH292]|uniref:hypothetical protein n=1 Tax=Aeoliella sp. SH292 TaxID=3454464 RepID=UPI003F9C5DA7